VRSAIARALFGVLPMLPVMGLLIENYHWTWQISGQVTSGLLFLFGAAKFYQNPVNKSAEGDLQNQKS
jgi:hypothetical protein